MTRGALERLIAARIAENGPMALADYMGMALGHPDHGYYMARDPFGVQGDFTTAPEISQMFGELIGIWCADTWSKMSPGPVILTELGPGRGTLMADALRAARGALPEFYQAAEVRLVETSPYLRARQMTALAACGKTVQWHDRFDDVPPGPALVIANEFFDALPVHQVEARNGDWYERRVIVAADGALALAPGTEPAPAEITPLSPGAASDGDIFEAAPLRNDLAAAIATRLVAHGGAVLIIDYGHATPGFGDTFQAVRDHRFTDPFLSPGEADLTAHVDFSALALAAASAGAMTFGPMDMGPFLTALGLESRAERLKSGASAAVIKSIDAAVHRLTAHKQMGTVFKVLVIAAPGGPIPAPF